MAKVFVSYASEDLALAREVHRWLVDGGHEVFLDRDLSTGIAVGELWQQWLHERLRWADVVVCVVTRAYVASMWCAAEVGIAQSQGSRVLPLRAEQGVAHPMLEALQHADGTGDPEIARAELLAVLHRFDDAWPNDRSPFPGLRPFEVDEHRVFFGRAAEVGQLAELLRSPAERAEGTVLLVVGPSGCGKSSLVRAGLVPMLADEPGWLTLAPIVPGADPVAALTRELVGVARQLGLDWTVTQVRQRLDSDGLVGLVEELLVAAPQGPRRLLVVVDQFEELLTQTTAGERIRFAELLRPALPGPVRLVGTLRPEFLDRLLADFPLAGLPTRIYPLRPLRREALREVIEGPARLAEIGVEAPLVARLVDDTDSGEALPLLAFTLAQLAEGVGRGEQLSAPRYEQLGGVQGALTRQADAALAAAVDAGGRSRAEVIGGLLRLVTVDEQGRPTRWRVGRAELPTVVVTELDAFVARRLLITDTDNGVAVIGVAHEAFLSAWPPLAEAISTSASALRARRIIEHAATEWHQKGRPTVRLWAGGQLATAVADTTNRVDLSTTAHDFLRDGINRDRRHRRRSTIFLSMLLAFALAGMGIAVIQQRYAEKQQRFATARELVARADAIRDTDPRMALQLGIAAEHIHSGGGAHSSLVHILTTTRYAGTLTDGSKSVSSVAFAPDRSILATGSYDGKVILWDVSITAKPHRLVERPLTGHGSLVSSVAFTPDGRILATGGYDGKVILWDISIPAKPRRLVEKPLASQVLVTSVAFTPDQRTLAIGDSNGRATMWNVTDPTQPSPLGSPLIGHRRSQVTSVAFSVDGQTLATGSDDGTAILWDLTDPARPHFLGPPLSGHSSLVSSVAFSANGKALATGSHDGTAILWDLTDPARPSLLGPPLTGHRSQVTSVAFSGDGQTLATGGDDGTAILWDLTDPARPSPLGRPLTGHHGRVISVALSGDGTALATGSDDGTAILWELVNPAQPGSLGQPLRGHDSLVSAVEFTHKNTLITISSDDTAIEWAVNDRTQPRPVGPSRDLPSRLVSTEALSADGAKRAEARADGTVILWDLTEPARPRHLGRPLTGHRGPVNSLAFSADGNILATADSYGAVILWDLTDPTRPRSSGLPSGHRSWLNSVALDPDGRTLAAAGADGVVLWDLTDLARPRPLGQPLTGHRSSVNSVAFSLDGDTLATGSADATVILWDLRGLNQLRDDAAVRACSLTGRGLDEDEWSRHILGLAYRNTCQSDVVDAGGDNPR